MEHRKIVELKHDEKILEKNRSDVWGWSTAAGRSRLQRRSALINNFIISYLDSKKIDNIKILELGCGIGLFTETLFCSSGSRIISSDIYEGFVHKAYDRARKADREVTFLVADAETLPFSSESFDIIFGVSVLHHLNLDIALSEINRVLKPGGKFIFSEPNMMNPQIFIQKNCKFIKEYLGDSPSETAFFASNLKKDFNGHDLKVEIMPFDFLHPKTPSLFIPVVSKLGFWLEKHPFLRHMSGSLLIQGEKI